MGEWGRRLPLLLTPPPREVAGAIALGAMLMARTVGDAVRAVGVTEVIASGGGTRDPTLMGRPAESVPGIALRT